MKLEDIVNNNQVIDLDTLKTDEELVEQIQTQLSTLLLYPSSSIDGLYAKRTEQALIEFCEALHLNSMATGKFGKTFAEKLLHTKELPENKFLSDGDYERAAEFLGVEVAAIRAVVEVEASGRGFLDDGRPKILFERHHFWQLSAVPVSQTRPDLSNPKRGGWLSETGEWDRLNDAIKFDRTAALKSASWGLGQVMGFNHEFAGYSDVEAFINAMHQSEGKQLDAMMSFIKKNNLDSALRRHDWVSFARGYNGPAGVGVYDRKLAKAYERHKASEAAKTNGSAKVTQSLQEIQAIGTGATQTVSKTVIQGDSTTATRNLSTTATHIQVETPQATLIISPAGATNREHSPIKLLDTYKHWKGDPHQVEAIAHLDKNISDALRAEVTRLWRSAKVTQSLPEIQATSTTATQADSTTATGNLTKHPSGIWIWELDKIRSDYLETLNALQCQRIYLKVLDDATTGIFWGWQCNPEIINVFENHGIEVWGWGYIFNKRSSTDTSAIIDAVRRAVGCGIKGFIFDVEEEVKNPATHSQLREILRRSKHIIPVGCMGYTSFGSLQSHTGVPYKMLNELCDLQFPQIYFEKFTFGSGTPSAAENEAEVLACIDAHKTMRLNKPILPIWGSESDSRYPATANELQNYLAKYPGSSIWRAPNAGERGEAWNCKYNYAVEIPENGHVLQPNVSPYKLAPLPLPFERELQLGDRGKDVYVLICTLMGLGFLRKDEQVTDVFDTNVDEAVRSVQRRFDIVVDGIVGAITKSSLENAIRRARGVEVPPPPPGGFKGSDFARFCEEQLRSNIPWTPDIKFVQPFVRELGRHRWPWCGATVHWLINEFLFRPNGKTMPLRYPGMTATFALVEAFQQFFQKQGWYQDNKAGYVPPPGAIVMFDWQQINIDAPDRSVEDHIGVFLRMNGDLFVCAEGNTQHKIVRDGRTAIMERQRKSIQGFGIIPEGWIPPETP